MRTTRVLARRLSVAVLLACALPVAADEVFLSNGGQLDGKAFRENGLVRVELETGSLVFPESAVVRIVPGPSPAERRAAARAERLESLAGRIAAVGLDDADGLYQVAQDVRLEGFPHEEVRYVLGFVLGADPDHAGARNDLGEVFFEGQWRPRDEAGWMEERREAAEMRSRGYLLVDGAWVTPEEADWANREAEWEGLASELESERDSAEYEADSLSSEVSSLRGTIAGLEAELSSARSEIGRLESDVHSLECAVADLEGRVGHFQAKLSSCQSALASVETCD